MKLYGKLTKSICAIVLAVALFLISGIDAIEFVGKYKVVERVEYTFGETYVSEQKYYLTFDIFGNLTVRAENGTSSDELQKWSVSDGKLLRRFPDGDFTRDEYSIGFGEITIIYEDGWDTETIVLKRAGLEGWLCPSMLLRAIALALLIFGLLSLLRKPKDAWDYTTPVAGGSVSNKPQEKVPEEPAKYCANCGASMSAGAKFCPSCGAPKGAESIKDNGNIKKEDTVQSETEEKRVPEENTGNDFRPAGDL